MTPTIICVTDNSRRKFACISWDGNGLSQLGSTANFADELRANLAAIGADGLSIRTEQRGSAGLFVGIIPVTVETELYGEAVCEYFRTRGYWAQAFEPKRAELWRRLMLVRLDDAEIGRYMTTIDAIPEDMLDETVAALDEARRELAVLAGERRDGRVMAKAAFDAAVQQALRSV